MNHWKQYNILLVSGVESLMCTTRAMTKMDKLMAVLLKMMEEHSKKMRQL